MKKFYAGENQNKLEEVIKTSLESIRSMIDSNTVIGNPISTEAGVTIIPISKISVGYASGGVDFNGKNKPENKEQNFSVGRGDEGGDQVGHKEQTVDCRV